MADAAAGPGGPPQARFEAGLRFLGLALALERDPRGPAAALNAACDALRCFMAVLDAAAERRLPDPEGGVRRLRDQCQALLGPGQARAEAVHNAVAAACLARDEAARLLPELLDRPQ